MICFNSKNRKLKSDARRIANSEVIQKQEAMILEICSSGALEVPNAQARDVLRYPKRKVSVIEHPGNRQFRGC